MERKDYSITPAAMDILRRHPSLFGHGPWAVENICDSCAEKGRLK
ncbi:hypothetical protein [Maritalea mobilis]|nr:hypothetical protein [Maritalea mobilis]